MTQKPFKFSIDSQSIKELAQILDEVNLSEIEYEDNGRRLRISRQVMAQDLGIHPSQFRGAPAPMEPASPSPVAQSSKAPEEASPQSHAGALKSPMVGTLYRASEPGAAPFISEGDTINEGDTVFIIEAMKVMNPVKATKTGTVKKIFFNNADPVEFGDVLMIVE